METFDGSEKAKEELLNQWVDRYQLALLQMCYMYLHDRAMAEDAVQETYLKAYRNMKSFRRDCSEKTWLIRIALNTCRDMRRSAWFRHTDHFVSPEDVEGVRSAPNTDDDAEALAQAITKLPAKHKEVVLLYYYQDMTMKEIAGLLGIAVSSVSSRLKQACAKLRHALEKEDAYGR